MLSYIVRQSMYRVSNRFELVVVAAERCRQLLLGAPATVENPHRERLMKVALREIVDGHISREGDLWTVERPELPDLLMAAPPPRREDFAELAGDDEEE